MKTNTERKTTYHVAVRDKGILLFEVSDPDEAAAYEKAKEITRKIDIADRIRRDDQMKWLTIDSAPRDGTTIIGWCDHEADPYCDEDRKLLTAYGANAEGASHVDDGVNLVRWHDGLADGEYCTPAWWCLADDYGETAANPTYWMPLPEPPVPA